MACNKCGLEDAHVIKPLNDGRRNMMKSRLKELKDNHEFGKGEGWEITILSEDIDWLIEQAEKVSESQKEIEQLKDSANEVINSKDIIIRRQHKEIEKLKNRIS